MCDFTEFFSKFTFCAFWREEQSIAQWNVNDFNEKISKKMTSSKKGNSYHLQENYVCSLPKQWKNIYTITFQRTVSKKHIFCT